MFMSELLGQSHHKQMVLLKKKITVMSQGQMVDFVKIRKNVKRFGCKNKTCMRIKHACVEVTHVVRAMTEEIVVMHLYEMVLYVNASHVLNRLQCNKYV